MKQKEISTKLTIKELCNISSLDSNTIAERAGMPESRLKRLQNDKARLTVYDIVSLSRVLQVKLEAIYIADFDYKE